MTQPSVTATLSVLSLRPDTRALVRDAQAWHGIVRRCVSTEDGQRVLWALPSWDRLVVQSPHPLDERRWAGIATRMRHRPVATAWGRGDAVTLSLIANPTRTVFTRGQRGRRVALPVEEVEGWARRKLAAAVACDTVRVQGMGARSGQRDTGRVTHRFAAITADAIVVDPDALRGLVLGGVGAGKAYGAGLLIVERVA